MTPPRHDPGTVLSVIIPAYNIAGYIQPCIASVLAQPHATALEIIIVDDGSTDRTAAAIDAAIAGAAAGRIEVIRQRNRGLSEARNAALARSRSPYVTFLDGDDYWLPDFTEQVMPVLRHHAPDVVAYDLQVVGDDGQPLDRIEVVRDEMQGFCVVDDQLRRRFIQRFHTFAPARIFKRALFERIAFPADRAYEDAATIPRLYCIARTHFGIRRALLCYRRRPGSITHWFLPSVIDDLATTGREMLAELQDADPGGSRWRYWDVACRKIFDRACFVCARVERSMLEESFDMLHALARDYLRVRGGAVLASRSFPIRVHAGRALFLIKQHIKQHIKRRISAAPSR